MSTMEEDDNAVIVNKKDVVEAIENTNSTSVEKKDGVVMSSLKKVEKSDETNVESSPKSKEEEKEDDLSPRPVQICSVGTDENEYAFTFHDERLSSILSKIPAGQKVSVVSVVGAFRTGKSFLLSWFLRYLHHHSSDRVITQEDEKDGSMWYEQFDSLGQDGFHWRGGAERNTTGIWMWSHPYFMERKLNDGSKEKIAVVLVDTQGMFDHETTMGLTAAIFGLSTLLSSYQIYNVDKRIQEDNLQQLALFSEYGRMALKADEEGKKEKEKEKKKMASPKNDKTKDKDAKKENPVIKKPFQKIDFLVRDWQNFDDEDDLDQCEVEMAQYLENVIAERAAADLKDTRDQINSCFEEISCYMFTHPGSKVTKKTYEGEVKYVDETFLALLNRFCHRVFHERNLTPKMIHGRELTAAELGVYIKAYAAMFTSGAHFPEASTMLEATASANNANATNASVRKYHELMDKLAGPRVDVYTQTDTFEELHKQFMAEVNEIFDSMANFGSLTGIDKARKQMMKTITDEFELYSKLNESRNPLAGLEIYLIPMAVAALSLILRWFADNTCSSWSQTCKASSDALSHLYQVVFFFLLIIAASKAKQMQAVWSRLKNAIEAIAGVERPAADPKKKD